MNKQLRRCFAGLVLALATLAPPAQASVVITGTRVIYLEKNREVSIRLTNEGGQAALVQTWVDDGRADSAPNEVQVPFILTPPVFRMESKKGQTLRLMFTGGDLPKDRESVYWLNVLEIPPKPLDAENRNLMQLAFRTRIKIFYRPDALLDDSIGQLKRLHWQLVAKQDGKGMLLRASNPSPYYISFGDVKIEHDGKEIDLNLQMIAPHGSADFVPSKGELHVSGAAKVLYTALSDYGAAVKETVDVSN
ncbi:fimbria/pilus periplasmic chaperone [Paraherbaspirillum soli]|uniref:Fimbria/pilus periplasmic chaperone n=1 Tax=Paraherbaspirillum soli TaxID=631222 RepID=A0ABW0M5B0_9BURK